MWCVCFQLVALDFSQTGPRTIALYAQTTAADGGQGLLAAL